MEKFESRILLKYAMFFRTAVTSMRHVLHSNNKKRGFNKPMGTASAWVKPQPVKYKKTTVVSYCFDIE
jgi:hypothetical protein